MVSICCNYRFTLLVLPEHIQDPSVGLDSEHHVGYGHVLELSLLGIGEVNLAKILRTFKLKVQLSEFPDDFHSSNRCTLKKVGKFADLRFPDGLDQLWVVQVQFFADCLVV